MQKESSFTLREGWPAESDWDGAARSLRPASSCMRALRSGSGRSLVEVMTSDQSGWTRVDAASDAAGVLASAWLSPAKDALTVILINAGNEQQNARIALPAGWSASEVTRSVFSGSERSAKLGALSTSGVVTLPPRAVMTVALSP